MVGLKLNKLLLLVSLFIMLVPVSIGTAMADETGDSGGTDESSPSRSMFERSAISGKDSKTLDVPERLESDSPDINLLSMASLGKEGSSKRFLGKNPNLAMNFINTFGGIQEGASSRAEPADNNPSGANVMTNGMPLRSDTVGGSDSNDWYSIDLVVDYNTNKQDEVSIKIKNKETTPGKNLSVILYDNSFTGWPLVSNMNWRYTAGPNTYEAGGIEPDTNFTVKARASRTGTYYMRIFAGAAGGSYSYDIVSVSVVKMNLAYFNNEWAKASKETSSSFPGSVNQASRHWAWHNISTQITKTGPDWENNITFKLDIQSESSGPIQELASAGSIIWVSWTMLTVVWNDNNNNFWYYNNWWRTGSSSQATVNNNPVDPRNGWVVINGSYVYFGVETICAFLRDDGSNLNLDFWRFTGNSAYSISITVTPKDLNFAPQLNFGEVTPTKGNVTGDFVFEVLYTDLNNEPPQSINVTVDDTYVFPMEIKAGESTDYSSGVVYQKVVSGDAIGDDPYPHRYIFKADDGRKFARNPLSGSHEDLYIISNDPVVPDPDRPVKWVMDEDDEPEFIDLYTVFLDPDGAVDVKNDPDQNTLDFKVWDAAKSEWGTRYINDFVEVLLLETGDYANHVKITPLPDKFGETVNHEIKFKAIDESKYGTDDYSWEAEVEMPIIINPVNDAPIIDEISDLTKKVAGALKEDKLWRIDFNATDVDGQTLRFSTDIEDVFVIDGEYVLKTNPIDYGYSFDAYTGNMTLIPPNEFVGTYTITVTVTDTDLDNPLSDSDEFEIEILNTNDAPVITSVGNQNIPAAKRLTFTATQNKKLELDVFATDPDIEIGESDSLKFKIEPEERENLLINEDTGVVTYIPDQSDVDNRGIDFSIVVLDYAQLSDDVAIHMKVINVNDPPSVSDVEILIVDADDSTPEPENLTVSFKVEDPFDPDGDTIYFYWDFDNSENLDNLGEGDDDKQMQGMEITWTYENPGDYKGTLTVVDSKDEAIKFLFNVTVKEPKTKAPPLTKPPEEETDKGALGLGKTGSIDNVYLISLLIIIIIVTFLVVMLTIRKKKVEIEKMRHAERFRQEDLESGTMGPDGLPVRPEEGMDSGGFGTKPMFPEEQKVARSASELYKDDSAPAMPSLFDISMQQQQAGPALGGQAIGVQPFGVPQQQPQQPKLSLPPAATQIRPAGTATPPAGQVVSPAKAEVQKPAEGAADSGMKCTSCGTPINPEWFICPGCHRFLK